MSFQRNRSSKEPMSEINVTPFVDVMLVLLIIFMVTAPLLTVGVQVDLPESAADSLPDDQEPLTLTINSKGEVFIQEHQVAFDKIKQVLPEFECQWTVEKGIVDLLDKLREVQLDKDMFNRKEFYRLQQIEFLHKTHKIDDNLFWAN